MNAIYLVGVGEVPERVWEWIENMVLEWFPGPVCQLPALPVPPAAYDAKRRQYQSVEIMKMVAQQAPSDALRILAVTNVDLAIPMLSFLFGQAQVGGPVALVSVCRLRQEFYGLPADETLLKERVTKEVLHELGHTFGLAHCSEPKCAMSLATHIGLVDTKKESYCERCGMQVVYRIASLEVGV